MLSHLRPAVAGSPEPQPAVGGAGEAARSARSPRIDTRLTPAISHQTGNISAIKAAGSPQRRYLSASNDFLI